MGVRRRSSRPPRARLAGRRARSALDRHHRGHVADDAAAITAAIDRAHRCPLCSSGTPTAACPSPRPGITRLSSDIVYVTAFALDAGESAASSMGGSLPEWWGIADGQVTMGRSREERVDMIAADCPPRLPREASEQLADLFRPHSSARSPSP